MAYPKIIVFGATGSVARHAALEAFRRGGDVVLSSRDKDKFIHPTDDMPSFPTQMACVQSDLSHPYSIKRALQETGATVAFVYVVHGQDIRVTARALKQGGIQHVVLLSSFMVYPSIEASLEEGANRISASHAAAEVAFREEGLVVSALRPMYFTSNIRRGIREGKITLYRPDSVDDYIAPEDIGLVAGARLVELRPESEVIPLCGPELMSKKDAWGRIEKEMGRKIEVTEVNREEYVKMYSETVAQHVDKEIDVKYPRELYEVAKGNVKKYAGKEATTLKEWVGEHKSEFKL